MLERLLERVRAGGTLRIPDLARELGTSPEMVEAMFESLSRMGYVKALDNSCGTQCGGCAIAGACGSNPTKLWTLGNTRRL